MSRPSLLDESRICLYRPTVERGEPLSRREYEVVGLIAEGLTDAEIAERLSIAVRTVHVHVSIALFKSRRRNRVALAVAFVRGNLEGPS